MKVSGRGSGIYSLCILKPCFPSLTPGDCYYTPSLMIISLCPGLQPFQ